MKLTKYCKGCMKYHPIEEFGINVHSTDGHRARCKECTRAAGQKYYSENSEKIQKRRAEANPRPTIYAYIPRIVRSVEKRCPSCNRKVYVVVGAKMGVCPHCLYQINISKTLSDSKNRGHTHGIRLKVTA